MDVFWALSNKSYSTGSAPIGCVRNCVCWSCLLRQASRPTQAIFKGLSRLHHVTCYVPGQDVISECVQCQTDAYGHAHAHARGAKIKSNAARIQRVQDKSGFHIGDARLIFDVSVKISHKSQW